MKRIFPTDDKIKFLVADDVRQEVSGKAIIIGYYSDDSISVSYSSDIKISKEQPLVIPLLCLLWVFTDGKGIFDSSASIINSNGIVIKVFSQKMQNPTGTANLLLKLSPFIIHDFGDFECCVDLGDGHQYKRKFSVINKTI